MTSPTFSGSEQTMKTDETTLPGLQTGYDASPRQGVRRILAVGVALFLFAGIVLLHRSVTGDLLSNDGGMSAFPGEDVVEPFREGDEVQVNYQHNGRYTFAFTLQNESRWAVRVVGFPVTSDASMLQPVAFSVDTTPSEVPLQTPTRFHPFTIDPGNSALVQVEARFANCEGFGADTSSTLVSLPVRYRALWATRTRWIDLPTAVQVPAPESCPTS
jgi:hypothetical protein